MYKKLLLIIIFTQIGLSLTQLGLTFGRATDGDKLVALETQADSLRKENESLTTQIQSVSVIELVRGKAEAMGMQPAKLSLLAPLPVAAKPESP